MKLHIVDNEAGVAETIRDSLFNPFVSEGKQNGTGLGLTTQTSSREHGGTVELLRTVANAFALLPGGVQHASAGGRDTRAGGAASSVAVEKRKLRFKPRSSTCSN